MQTAGYQHALLGVHSAICTALLLHFTVKGEKLNNCYGNMIIKSFEESSEPCSGVSDFFPHHIVLY